MWVDNIMEGLITIKDAEKELRNRSIEGSCIIGFSTIDEMTIIISYYIEREVYHARRQYRSYHEVYFLQPFSPEESQAIYANLTSWIFDLPRLQKIIQIRGGITTFIADLPTEKPSTNITFREGGLFTEIPAKRVFLK